MNLHCTIQKLTTQQWNLNNFRLPLTIDAILVVTISATGSARLPLDLYFSPCKTRTPFFFATHQNPLGYGFSNYNLTNSLWFSCRFKINENYKQDKKNMLNILFHSTLSTLWTSKALWLFTQSQRQKAKTCLHKTCPTFSHYLTILSPFFSTFLHTICTPTCISIYSESCSSIW